MTRRTLLQLLFAPLVYSITPLGDEKWRPIARWYAGPQPREVFMPPMTYEPHWRWM